MKKILDLISRSLLFIILIPVMLIMAIMLLFTLPIRYIERKRIRREYLKYLRLFEGMNIFCYHNNDRESRAFIKQTVLPYLPKEVEVIYIDGSMPSSSLPPVFVIEMLSRYENNSGRPSMIKIRDGGVIRQEMKTDVAGAVQADDNIPLLYELLNFFDLDAELLHKII